MQGRVLKQVKKIYIIEITGRFLLKDNCITEIFFTIVKKDEQWNINFIPP